MTKDMTSNSASAINRLTVYHLTTANVYKKAKIATQILVLFLPHKLTQLSNAMMQTAVIVQLLQFALLVTKDLSLMIILDALNVHLIAIIV